MALLRVAEALCALADGALRQLADWVEWEPSREASEECGQSRSVNRWRSLLWSAAQFPVPSAHTRTQHSSIHPLSVIVLGFFSFSLFLFSPHLPKSSLLCSCWATSSQQTPPTSVVGLSFGTGLRAKDGVLTGSMSWWHKRTGNCYIHAARNHCKTCTYMQCVNYNLFFNRVLLLQHNFQSPNS